MFNFFKKNINKKTENAVMPSFEIELTASVLAYEIARSDGDVSEDELSVLMMEIKKIANKDEINITDTAEVHISNNILMSTFVVDKV